MTDKPDDTKNNIIKMVRKETKENLREKQSEERIGKTPWMAAFKKVALMTDGGEIRDVVWNVVEFIERNPMLQGRIFWNELSNEVDRDEMPWPWEVDGQPRRPWSDLDDGALAVYCQGHGLLVKTHTCAEAVQQVASRNAYHPVKDLVLAEPWDGVERLPNWLQTYMGAPDIPIVREFGFRWFLSLVKRVWCPGCKADHILIVEGPQGIGKSTALRIIALRDAWFADEIGVIGTKDAGSDLQGKVLLELAELDAWSRAAKERQKAWVSRQIDRYRPSYGRRSQDFPRACVFAATTNDDTYLTDETGNRRSLPVKCGTIDREGLRRDALQMWREAVVRLERGELWWISEDMGAQATKEQSKRLRKDAWEEPIAKWLHEREQRFMISDVLTAVLDLRRGEWDRGKEMRVSAILKAIGCERKQERWGSTRVWMYHPPPKDRKA